MVNFLQGILVLCMIFVLILQNVATAPGNESDRLALLDFKSLITEDPLRIMSSWNDSVHFCNWVGVTCNSMNERVMILNLESLRLSGSIPPSVGNLTFLTGINLMNNSFRGEVPEEMGRLTQLQHMNFTYNLFSGKIPVNISHCTNLKWLDLVYNELIGEIPDQLSSFSKLLYFGLGGNNLTDKIPPWIGNFSDLIAISLAQNNLEGVIPDRFGQLSKLGFFQVYGNQLSGTIPPPVFNISSIYYFSVTENQLQGELPPNVGHTLPNLKVFAGGVNNFTGQIPESLANASGLQVLDFAENGLTGNIPGSIRNLRQLVRLNFDQNRLGNSRAGDLNFFDSLVNCTALQVLGLAENLFGGELPLSITNLSRQLEIITLGGNLISGTVPVGIGSLGNLEKFALGSNYLSGRIPDDIGNLKNLEGLEMNFNRFSGSIPLSFGNLTKLTRLFMEENMLEGTIPASIGDCQSLQVVNLSSNNLSGNIPKELVSISSLSTSLVLSNNSLTGEIPLEVGSLVNLVAMDFSGNMLCGEIPSSLGSCVLLGSLRLESNRFEGSIPGSFRSLRGLNELDLSSNNLSGEVPELLSELQDLKLLNLSFNNFVGQVSTKGVFSNASTVFITGNEDLCGGIPELHLRSCWVKKQRKYSTRRMVILSTIPAICLQVIIGSFVLFYFLNHPREPDTEMPGFMDDQRSNSGFEVGISYSDLIRATHGFSDENMIGSGSFGSVYKGSLDGSTVAVKVINLLVPGASRSFVDECNALRAIRHRNLLKIITASSTFDHQGNNFKCIIFEYISNGSLDRWIHPTAADERSKVKRLSLVQRLNIAIDVASALDYLHNHCEIPIVHCDLKPSSVLLDGDMTAHVGDFGLARFLLNPSNAQNISVGLKGSIGYIPPEYGTGSQVSTKGDAFSYGILLLEMFTGKPPTDDLFKEDLSLHKYVIMSLPENIMDVIDNRMLEEEKCYEMEERARIRDGDHGQVKRRGCLEGHVMSVLQVGLSCSARTAYKRMEIKVALNKLQDIRNSFLKSSNWS